MWNIDRQLFVDSMTDSLLAEKPVPRWFLMLRNNKIIGGYAHQSGVDMRVYNADTMRIVWKQ